MTTIVAFATYALASIGLSFIVGFSKISLPLRVLVGGRTAHVVIGGHPEVTPTVRPLVPWLGPWLVALLECPGCLGFWVGVFTWCFRSELGLTFFSEPSHFFPTAFVWGLVTCATNMLGARAIGMLE